MRMFASLTTLRHFAMSLRMRAPKPVALGDGHIKLALRQTNRSLEQVELSHLRELVAMLAEDRRPASLDVNSRAWLWWAR